MYSIYDFPDIYERVLCHSPEMVTQEVNSILALLHRFGIESGSVLELACGTCVHAARLAELGFVCGGVDRSESMLARARQRAEVAGLSIDLCLGDVVDFEWPAPVDAVIFMSETFPLLTELADLRRHFASVRRALRPGGLYIVDIDAHRHGVGTSREVWGRRTVELEEGSVEIWHESLPGNWIEGTSHMKMHCRITKPDGDYSTEDSWRIRADSPWHLRTLVEALDDWELDGFYSWKDLSPEIQDEDHFFMVLT